MDATHRTLTWTPRRSVTTILCLTTVSLVAGGTGGYLVHGASGASRSASAPVVLAPAVIRERVPNADAASGYGTAAIASGTYHALNADAASGYATRGASAAP